MNVVQLTSGLGNQMFQYAFGLAAGARYDRSWFEAARDNPHVLYRPYGLDQFQVDVPLADPALVLRHNPKLLRFFGIYPGLRLTREKIENVYEPELLTLKGRNFVGYFQCEKYFKAFEPQLKAGFRLRNPSSRFSALADEMRAENSVSVHIRRGDYVGDTNLCLCGPDYYQRAVARMRERVASPKFYFFSDDIPWTRETFADVPGAVFVDEHWTETACDMMLMRECRHHIIANSSYSWWGAWLGDAPDKIVIAPSRWFADGRPNDIVPEGWVTCASPSSSPSKTSLHI